MTTINLHQNQDNKSGGAYSQTANGGFIFSLAILIATVATLYGLRFYIKSVQKENANLAANVAEQNKSLAGVNSLQRVLDMQGRLDAIKANLEIKDNKAGKLMMTEVLTALEKEMNSGVFISSYDFDNESKILKVSIESLNYNDAARQLLNFKQSDYFTGVELEGISKGDSGISSQIRMAIKNK